jgi:hypothetical protein
MEAPDTRFRVPPLENTFVQTEKIYTVLAGMV